MKQQNRTKFRDKYKPTTKQNITHNLLLKKKKKKNLLNNWNILTKLIVKPITFQFIFSNKFHKKKTKTQILKLVRKKKKNDIYIETTIWKQQTNENPSLTKGKTAKLTTEKREILKTAEFGIGERDIEEEKCLKPFLRHLFLFCCALLQLCLCTLHSYLSQKPDGCTTWLFLFFI